MSILIIGAGPSGLATAAELKRAGLHFDHVERHDGVGGLWDIDNPTTPMYESAHFISSKRLSCLPGRPFRDDVADYPPRAEIHRYLREFADDEGLVDGIDFGVEVVSVEAIGDGDDAAATTIDGTAAGDRYRVTMAPAAGDGGVEGDGADGEGDGGDGSVVKHYSDVICASGTLSTPNLPDIPGDFDGEYRHSTTYRGIDELRGKRVLIIGAGNSGCDIACDAAQAAESAELSMRRGYWFIPKHIFGKPSDEWTVTGPQLPARVMQLGAQAILRLYFGDLRKLGLPKPDHRIFETHPLLNDQLIHHLRHGDLSIRGDVARFDGPDVVFADGSRGSYDLVLACTGFHHSVPYAAELFGGGGSSTTPPNAMEALHLGCAHRERPGLWAPGLIETNSGAFGAIGQQARLIAAVLSSKERARIFAERRRTDDVDLSGGLKMDRSERHRGYVDSHALHAALADELEALGLDAGRERLGGLAG